MPVITQHQDLEKEFQQLASRWRRDTRHLSRIDHVCSHPSYLQIIGMGSDALAFIFRELERETDYWFVALSAITRTSPLPEDCHVDVEEMATAWLQWGREHGYVT